MVTGACVTLGLIHLRIAFGDGRRAPNLFFALCALAVAVISGMELALLRTTELTDYNAVMRWAVVPLFVMVSSVAGFVWSFLGTGRKWLAGVALSLHALADVVNLLSPAPVLRQAVALHQVETFGGARFTVATSFNGPWDWVELISVLLLLLFMTDASVAVFRRGERRKAVLVGGGIVFFLLVSRGHAVLIENGFMQTPYLVSFAFCGVLLAMGYDLSREVLNASILSRKLRESEQSMGLAAEAANLGMWIWDTSRDEVWMTEPGRDLFGFGPEERLNYGLFLQRVHPDDRMGRDLALKQTVENQSSFALEYRIALPGGRQRWVVSRGRCLDASNGRNRRLLGVTMDITAQKQAEDQARKQSEEMAHLGRVSLMGQLASALAHELNQPLGAILRNAEAAEIYLEAKDPDLEELRGIVADIRKDDQRAGAVIDRMRTMLKRHEIESAPLAVKDLLGDVAALTRSDAAARQIAVDIAGTAGLPLVRADRVHIQQVLLNLLLNAMDSLDGSRTRERRVTLRAHLTGKGWVEIAVSDTGLGIPEEKVTRVFEPFFTTKAQGMGMGLAISRTIIEAHGGKIWAENNPAGGATFRFTLPATGNGAV